MPNDFAFAHSIEDGYFPFPLVRFPNTFQMRLNPSPAQGIVLFFFGVSFGRWQNQTTELRLLTTRYCFHCVAIRVVRHASQTASQHRWGKGHQQDEARKKVVQTLCGRLQGITNWCDVRGWGICEQWNASRELYRKRAWMLPIGYFYLSFFFPSSFLLLLPPSHPPSRFEWIV